MATQKKKKATKKAKKKQTEVQRLIKWMEDYNTRDRDWAGDDDNNLCDVGLERLAWWKKNGKRFKTIHAAISTWTEEQILAYVDFISADFNEKGQNDLQLTADEQEVADLLREIEQTNNNAFELVDGLSTNYISKATRRGVLGITDAEMKVLKRVQERLDDLYEKAEELAQRRASFDYTMLFDHTDEQVAEFVKAGKVELRPWITER